MDDQIKGYRTLTPDEIELINEIKTAEARVVALHRKVVEMLSEEASVSAEHPLKGEPFRWAAVAKTDIQTGFMALVRAVARPGE